MTYSAKRFDSSLNFEGMDKGFHAHGVRKLDVSLKRLQFSVGFSIVRGWTRGSGPLH